MRPLALRQSRSVAVGIGAAIGPASHSNGASAPLRCWLQQCRGLQRIASHRPCVLPPQHYHSCALLAGREEREKQQLQPTGRQTARADKQDDVGSHQYRHHTHTHTILTVIRMYTWPDVCAMAWCVCVWSVILSSNGRTTRRDAGLPFTVVVRWSQRSNAHRASSKWRADREPSHGAASQRRLQRPLSDAHTPHNSTRGADRAALSALFSLARRPAHRHRHPSPP